MPTSVIPTPTKGPVGQLATFQARLVHANGSGAEVSEEGKLLQQTDFAEIDCEVYDFTSASPGTVIATPGVVIANAITDALVDDSTWTKDTVGRNFIHSISGSVFNQPHLYRVVYTAKLSAALGSETLVWAYGHIAVAVTTTSAFRTNQQDVREALQTNNDFDVTPFIKHAHRITNKVRTCAINKSLALDAEQLESIETYLAAHLYALFDPQEQSITTERASATFQGQTGMNLDSTRWGQMAKTFDTSGCLASFDKGARAGFVWLGKPPSDQIDYEDRD